MLSTKGLHRKQHHTSLPPRQKPPQKLRSPTKHDKSFTTLTSHGNATKNVKHSPFQSQHQHPAPSNNNNNNNIFLTMPPVRTQTIKLAPEFFHSCKESGLLPFEAPQHSQHESFERTITICSKSIPGLNPSKIIPTHGQNIDFETYLSSLQVSIKRIDEVHTDISGNKFYKLQHNLLPYITTTPHPQPIICTFGGAFSNHIAATAVATAQNMLKSIGMIRGEELSMKPLNHTLTAACGTYNMAPFYLDRFTYKHRNHPLFNEMLIQQISQQKHLYYFDELSPIQKKTFHTLVTSYDPSSSDFFIPLYLRRDYNYDHLWDHLELLNPPTNTTITSTTNHSDREVITTERSPPLVIIPEGGTNPQALIGTSKILTNHDYSQYSHIITAVGTGGTLGGLVQGLIEHRYNKNQSSEINQDHTISPNIVGFAAVSPDEIQLDQVDSFIKSNIETNINDTAVVPLKQEYRIVSKYLGKGYGYTTPSLLQFMKYFHSQYDIPLEQIYTGKLVYGVFDMINSQQFPTGSNILLLHTGGLQGVAPH